MNKKAPFQIKDSFDYSSLPSYLKFSNWLSWQAVTSNLIKGNWLDIMCGYQAVLQCSQISNHKINQFFCIDQELNPNLANKNFNLKVFTIKQNLPYKENAFDNITLINGLEHLWEAQPILNECYRILKKDGVLQIIVPTWWGKKALEFLAFKLKVQPQIFESMNDHKMYYDEKLLWPLLVKAGFQPKDISLKRIKFFWSLYSQSIKS